MVEFFEMFAYIATIVAAFIYVILCIGLMANSAYINDEDVFQACVRQAKTCRKASFLFCVVIWLLASCMSKAECLQIYGELSVQCFLLGSVWMLFAFVCILLCVFLGIARKKKTVISKIETFRNGNFLMSILFLLCSVLLNV
jgi:hypothetical protein